MRITLVINYLLVHNPNYLHSLPNVSNDIHDLTVLQPTQVYNIGADAK